MIDIKISEHDNKIISLWNALYSAFNTITFDGKRFIISGADYSENINFSSFSDLMDFIENEVKAGLLFHVLEKNTETISRIINEF